MNWTEDEEEQYDQGDEDDEGDQQPTLWSATKTLVDGFKKRSPVQPDTESCKSYNWDLQDLQSLHPHWETQELSFGLKQCCEPSDKSPSLTARSNFLVQGAEKDSEVSTDCYDFLGSAGAGKDLEMSTTKADSYEFLGSAEKVCLFLPQYHSFKLLIKSSFLKRILKNFSYCLLHSSNPNMLDKLHATGGTYRLVTPQLDGTFTVSPS